MKNYAVILLILLCPFFPAKGNIFNGFLIEKLKLEKSIKACEQSLIDAKSEKSARQTARQLKKLQKEYNIVARKFTQTQSLIELLRTIDPVLFANVDTVTNSRATLTHVYVRFVYSTDTEFTHFTNYYFNALAYTSVRPATEDKNGCYSQYGNNTITITIGKCHDEILALAHEFAHVLYTVPNIKTY